MSRKTKIILIMGVIAFCVSITLDLLFGAVFSRPVVLGDSISAMIWFSGGAWAFSIQELH